MSDSTRFSVSENRLDLQYGMSMDNKTAEVWDKTVARFALLMSAQAPEGRHRLLGGIDIRVKNFEYCMQKKIYVN